MSIQEIVAYLGILVSWGITCFFYRYIRTVQERNHHLNESIAFNTSMSNLEDVVRNEKDLSKALNCVVSTLNALMSAEGIIIVRKEKENACTILAETYDRLKLRSFLLAHIDGEALCGSTTSTRNNQCLKIIHTNMGSDEYLNSIILRQNSGEIEALIAVHIITESPLESTNLNQYNKLLYHLGSLTMLALELDNQRSVDQLLRQKQDSERRSVELTERLEQELKYKTLQNDFISMASHEFRTPLAVIASSIYLIQRQVKGLHEHWNSLASHAASCKEAAAMATAEIREQHNKAYEKTINLIGNINSYVNHLSSMIASILKITAMEESGIQNAPQLVNLSTKVIAAIGRLQHLRNDISIDYQDSTQGKYIWFDPSNLDHVMTNLISNAIKYSQPNTQVKVVSVLDAAGHMVLHVRDQGIGIPKEQQERLFTKFFRGNNTAHITGIGVGLYVTKKLLALNNAEISVESEPGLGTTFTVTFPIVPDPIATDQML